MRIEQVRGQAVERGTPFTFTWGEQEITAYEGETILGALLAAGVHTLRTMRFTGEPRGMLCGIGVCYECLVMVDGKPNRRACVTLAQPGMQVHPGESSPVVEFGEGEGGDEHDG